jgi:acetamidase/formamidase
VTGVRVDSFLPGDRVLTEIRDELRDSMAVTAEDTCERGDVMRIEMADGHIYCVGDTPDEYIVSHNLKPANDF